MIILDNLSLASPVNNKEIQLLAEFRYRIQNETNLECPMDDVYLLSFLRHRNLDLDRAFNTLQETWKMSVIYKEICDGMFPSNFTDIYDTKFSHPLCSVDVNGRPVLLVRLENWDPSKYTIIDMCRASHLIMDTLIKRQVTQLHGLVIILDFEGIGISHLRGVTLKFIKFAFSMLDLQPVKVKAIHIVNNSFLTNGLWKCAQAFLKPKLRKRVYVHGSKYESLHKHIKSETLPETYGGKLDIIDAYEQNFIEKVMARDNYFRELFKHCRNPTNCDD